MPAPRGDVTRNLEIEIKWPLKNSRLPPRNTQHTRGPRAPRARGARDSARACVRAPARGARAPRRRVGGAKERRARGATDGTREEQGRRRAPRRARTPLLDCGGDQPPAIHARCARRAASPVAPRAPPALRTERRRSRREDARQGRRPATGRRRKKNRGGEDHHSVRRPCVSAAARAAHACAARPGRAQPTPTPGDSPRRCPRTVAPPARQFAR